MKIKNTFKNLITLLLFASFLLTYFLDLTGLPLHQWLGVAAAAAAALHLLTHWRWFKSVTARFFNKTSWQARSYYFLDILLFGGLALITLTGLLISTWFSLAVASYDFWRRVHIAASLISMVLLVIKLALHWKYIANMFRPARRMRPVSARPLAVSLQNRNPKLVSRREALRVIGAVSAAGVVGILRAASALRTVEAAQLPQPTVNTESFQPAIAEPAGQSTAVLPETVTQPTPVPQLPQTSAVEPQPSQSIENCIVRCSRGCSYPGRCRRYTDANNNQLCDLGECLPV